MIGIHINHKKIPDGVKEGFKCFQIFVGGPQSYKLIKFPDSEVKELVKLSDQGVRIYVHSSYVTYIWKDSRIAMLQIEREIKLSEKIHAKGYVLHLPKWETIPVDSKQFENILSRLPKLVLLETPANTVNSPAVMKKLRSLCKKYHLKWTIDTAHLWSSGVDISTYSKFKKWFDQYVDIIGLVHFNDSKMKLGSQIDRHEIVGHGLIWKGNKEYKKILDYILDQGIDAIYETHNLL